MFGSREKDLRRAWAVQLLAEHESICWQYKVGLKKPWLEITESLSVAGSWHPESRTIKIARWLLADYDWSVVLLVLKHEMAHQYVTEGLRGDAEVAHGLSFQLAADRLGLLKHEFRSASGHIPRILEDSGSSQSSLQKKIAKLFALAGSSNEHEANLALKKANELMRKYNLDRLGSHIDSEYDTIVINHRKKRIEAHQRLLGNILSDFYFVNVITSHIYDQHTQETYKTIELTGEKANLAIAEYVYIFLEKRLLILWQKHRKATGAPGKEKRSFYLGVLNGFKDKLEKDERAAVKNVGAMTSALIRRDDPGLEKYYHASYPRLRRVKHRGAKVNAESFKSGKKEGARLTIHKGINEKNGNLGRLLG